ncbi:hypothetical protein D9615_010093 [Tricholomella constricta]|uniref:Protein arginine methyltransferase NDUFAF7 n=1 Tax=Tricholomella constricta TaxID=117010 RepID=A0A8H5GXH4_9AGAR|nr:hypothetical protein D9615_010093 [Tricholomella constricta]
MLVSFAAFRARNRPLSSLRCLASAKWHRYQSPALRRYTKAAHAAPPITQVEKLLLDSIRATGPLSFATYMQACLSHPTQGYYMNPEHPVFGSRGDFITSPEISQVFGELVGIWLLSQWQSAGMPPAIRLIELGPGRGTLMEDILRVISQVSSKIDPSLLKEIHLVETSEAMREIQKQKLGSFVDKAGCDLHWHDNVDRIPPSPAFSMVVAHEFFDALPFYLLQKTKPDEWREVMIASALDPIKDPRLHPVPEIASIPRPPSERQPEPIYPRLRRVISPEPTPASIGISRLSPRFKDLPAGSFLEVSPVLFYKARILATLLGSSLSKTTADQPSDIKPTTNGGGCGLIIDYGDAKAFGDSFRAFKDHKIVDVFDRPGHCDLTTNVDFSLLREAMGDLVTSHGPITQGDFLTRMGISVRVDALARRAETEERRAAIREAADRLVDPVGMGKEYRFMGFTSFRAEGSSMQKTPVYPFEMDVD